jgi:5-hydroxyisourate hydrolase
MTDLPDLRLDRRHFALSTLAIGASALAPSPASAQDKPAQASGPIVLAGVSPRLTIHALDTYHGSAATGLSVDFSTFDGSDYKLVKSLKMNPNGRSDEPVLIGDTYKAGKYEFLLHVDDYFAMKGAKLPTPPFLSKVPIRFQIVNVEERIHLPIQFGPWSYQYSRGS